MKVVTEPVGEHRLFYVYPNAGLAAVDVWLAHPPECSVQDQVRLAAASLEPAETLDLGVQHLSRFRVPPAHVFKLSWAFRRLRPALREEGSLESASLSDEERSFYLEPSLQLPRDPRLVDVARRLTEEDPEPLRKAERVFQFVASEFLYAYPVRRRGALAMLEERRGDCGQLAGLFVALCRAIGLPARPLVGTRLTPWADAGHVWTEVWIDEVGWVPADPALGNALLRSGGDASRAFGRLESTYFAFSIGFDVSFAGRYGGKVLPVLLPARMAPRVSFGGVELQWGFEALRGGAPYLQPAYPRCFPGRGLSRLLRCSPLGHWTVRERLLPWLVLQDVLEQAWLPLALLLIALAMTLSWWSAGAAASCIAAVFGLAGLQLGLKAWLRGGLQPGANQVPANQVPPKQS